MRDSVSTKWSGLTSAATNKMSEKQKHRHLEISRHLLTEIAAGKYGASGRLPSEAHLSKQFKVSRPTVARALLDLTTEGIIERRAGSGSYVRNKSNAVPGTRQI